MMMGGVFEADVAVVGGGLGGSSAAAMLGQAGYSVVLIDPHAVHQKEFRCEKLDGAQVSILRKTGLADAVLAAATYDREAWLVRFDRVIERRRGDQHGILYQDLVNSIRRQIPASVAFFPAKATSIRSSVDQQTVVLSNGATITARLVIVATGLSVSLLDSLKLRREVLSPNCSVTAGFDLIPRDGTSFAAPALTYYFDRPAECMAYLTLFPVGSTMRANLFGYRNFQDPWFRQLRKNPDGTLCQAMPRLRNIIGDFEVSSFVEIRPADLYVTHGYRQPGLVLVGDAFSTSCPAAGTGARKTLNDIERLCNIEVPYWLSTPGMGEEKIMGFYADPVKQSVDAWSLAKAFRLRSLCTDRSLYWRMQRIGRLSVRAGVGAVRAVVVHAKAARG